MIYTLSSSMLIHGVSPSDLLLYTLGPIPIKGVINVIQLIIDK